MMWIILAAAAAASQPEVSCVDERTQMEINACAAREFEEADAQLNAAWKDASDWLKGGQYYGTEGGTGEGSAFAVLLKAQRAWLAYRDEHCKLVGQSAAGGSLQPFLISRCKTQLTNQRNEQLNDLTIEGE